MIKYSALFCYLLLLTIEIHARGRIVKRKTTTKAPKYTIESWPGKWFPHPPLPKDSWKGKWFPYPPYTNGQTLRDQHAKNTLSASEICDDGKQNIGVDHDPSDVRQTFEHLCLANRSSYSPNMDREAFRIEYFIPPAYVAPSKCLNETINYDTALPTYGAFRPIPPKYGSYTYLPAQRWVSSLSRGAIVMLYHPCAYSGQVKLLQDTLRACLYRHIITPTQALSPERALALLAWGKSLEMSVVDENLVVDFIRQNAGKGPNVPSKQQNISKTYQAGLLQEAHLVTDENDEEVCGYREDM
ncbi:PREDICTED: uncharacterized protein LOC108378655 [Rhagoletis zephyria]|uniref:uncharacterized protein LOC108378655 n=1 Tax=Rhagoletis zephyria TaxID=28612 RepID=UPI0008115596|nr:PREDICTED: uncharacterized protein LOC108378655 [Rhagoletis zephyria]